MSAETVEMVRQSLCELGLEADVSERADGMIRAVVSGCALLDAFNCDTTALHDWLDAMPDLFFMSMPICGDQFSIYWAEDD